ncbi:MAG: hypothetical protein BA862_00825 [Desulfobulbaceae bacterium S3730MH12]|nr:MAG: hypothetical protein BA866_09055 [Desulfobulbaceae bacterium S5133MH15]OEU54634.1 MAG: hypothetical protein BA862_00825 [Desulfobulbaceae bacterium S3730MH12]OEU83083.1 MAG: hypothetical protein BA873_00705 [Desulfobulbaceae bacterium C00003063]
MIHLNIRQKMILWFLFYLLFYVIYGSIYLRDFKIFKEDISHLIHAGKLSNICLEIRRYEKNFIIRHDEDDFLLVIEYVYEAQQYISDLTNDSTLIAHPQHLDELKKYLLEYGKTFHAFKAKCIPKNSDSECSPRVTLRHIGHELVRITDRLVQYEQKKMTDFVSRFKVLLFQSIAIFILLTVAALALLYGTIIIPLKSIETAAKAIASGTFRKLQLPPKHDEVSSVLHTFNNMVTELEEHQEQLFQAQKLSSIGTLASGTAHQINNPLNNIATSCQLALAETDIEQSPFTVQMLKTIDQETQRAGAIVRELLEFSRAQTFSMQEVQLKTVVNKVMHLVASEIPAGITVEKTIPENFILNLDVQKMVEAILNLLINGMQAIETPPGSVTITAVAKDNQAVITVKDTGTGIKTENLPKVFDPFFTTKKEGLGTGLGLAVVYGIIQKHDGTIHVKSEEGRGTRFIITLPFPHKTPGIVG